METDKLSEKEQNSIIVYLLEGALSVLFARNNLNELRFTKKEMEDALTIQFDVRMEDDTEELVFKRKVDAA